MKTAYHEFFRNFKCIANKCPDSCCKEWDVVVDDESCLKYKNAEGEFGEKLRKVMTTDEDGDIIFTLDKNRCPFWNSEMLCDIYINLGEGALCETCRRFPRINLDYSDFEEKILSLACPEALRLMLQKGAMQKSVTEENSRSAEYCDYDTQVMRLLIEAREKIFAVLSDDGNSIFDCINRIYKICLEVQSVLDGIKYESGLIFDENSFIAEYSRTIDVLLQLDIMTDEWRDLLKRAKEYKFDEKDALNFSEDIVKYDYEYKNLMYYYIFRYFLNSIDSGNVTECFNLMLFAVKSAYVLQLFVFADKGTVNIEQRHRIIGLYSKEVEHSYENIELLREKLI